MREDRHERHQVKCNIYLSRKHNELEGLTFHTQLDVDHI